MTGSAVNGDAPVRRGLLLDFDGTIADTLPVLQQTYDDFLRDINATHKAPTFAEANGANLLHLITDLSRQYAPDRNATETWRHYWQTVETAVLKAPPLQGTREIVAWAKQLGWTIGIASASRTDLIAAWLARHALQLQIDGVVGADLCERGKPDPAIYRLLIETLAIAPQDCIVIEDSESGVLSASRAGLEVIRLTGAHPSANSQAMVSHDAVDLAAALIYLQQRFAPSRQA
jgi:HAD superfamily hydrolase (TIGR01509 family)